MEDKVSLIGRKFVRPRITSQFRICPIPFHFDTYRGCHYGCVYCFARDLIEFQRRNKEKEVQKHQSFLEGNDPIGLERWIEKAMQSDYDYKKAEEVALKERMPLKIGAISDPFPLIETKEHITYDCLKVLGKYDYPVQISTKNPEVFLEYAHDFIGANIAFNVSCSFCDDDIAKEIEVNAISPTRRFEAIKKLSDMGFKVMVRMQPFILPYSENVAERFVKTLKDYGVWAFQTEGLKLRVVMPEKERVIYKKIGDVLGFDILKEFKHKGVIESGDRVYHDDDKRRVLELYSNLGKKYGVKFYNADNLIDSKYGCGSQCCGTDILRNYKIWGGCMRSKVFNDDESICSKHFGNCFINFTRSEVNLDKTIKEVTDEYCKEEEKRLRIYEYNKQHKQLNLFGW